MQPTFSFWIQAFSNFICPSYSGKRLIKGLSRSLCPTMLALSLGGYQATVGYSLNEAEGTSPVNTGEQAEATCFNATEARNDCSPLDLFEETKKYDQLFNLNVFLGIPLNSSSNDVAKSIKIVGALSTNPVVRGAPLECHLNPEALPPKPFLTKGIVSTGAYIPFSEWFGIFAGAHLMNPSLSTTGCLIFFSGHYRGSSFVLQSPDFETDWATLFQKWKAVCVDKNKVWAFRAQLPSFNFCHLGKIRLGWEGGLALVADESNDQNRDANPNLSGFVKLVESTGFLEYEFNRMIRFRYNWSPKHEPFSKFSVALSLNLAHLSIARQLFSRSQNSDPVGMLTSTPSVIHLLPKHRV